MVRAAVREPQPVLTQRCSAKTHYGTSLANVDWLHGTAESLLTVTNVLIVLGLRRAFSEASAADSASAAEQSGERKQ